MRTRAWQVAPWCLVAVLFFAGANEGPKPLPDHTKLLLLEEQMQTDLLEVLTAVEPFNPDPAVELLAQREQLQKQYEIWQSRQSPRDRTTVTFKQDRDLFTDRMSELDKQIEAAGLTGQTAGEVRQANAKVIDDAVRQITANKRRLNTLRMQVLDE